jgi:DNA-binding transcriptional LysR family regulator
MIDSMKVFCMVVKKKGFRAAASELGMSPAMVSRHVTKLEFELKTSLLKRNTRSLTLTGSGLSFYKSCGKIVNLYDQCMHQVSSDNKAVSGNLKVGIPHSISQLHVIPALKQFHTDYPDITLDIISGNHSLELFSHGYDLALHCGPLPDSALYYTLIGYWRKYTVASPEYLENHGTPQHPDNLDSHQCLAHFDNRARTWQYILDKENVDVPVFGQTRINNSLDLCHMALGGLGIAYLPDFTVGDMLTSGKLVSVLDSYMPPPLPMYVVHINPKPSKREQVFIDFIKTLSLARG